jgi:hypothetical protein
VSYFQIDYLANGYGDIDFTLIGQALAIAYNNLMEPRFSNEEDALEYTLYDDPFMRRMEAVEVLKVDGLRRLTDEKEDSRELQSSSLRNLNVYLRVTGSCRGCSSRSKFTNQVSRRLSKAKKRKLQVPKSGVNKGGGKGGSGPVPSLAPVTAPPVPLPTPPPTENAQTPPPVIVTPPPTDNAATAPPVPVTPAPVTPAPVTPAPVTPAPVTPAPVTPAPVTAGPTSGAATPPPFDDPSTLPTEEELRVAYAIEIQRWEFDIIDVTSLDEVDAMMGGPTNYTFSQMATSTNNCGGSSNQISSCP